MAATIVTQQGTFGFGQNIREFNQEGYYLRKDQIVLIHEYKYLGMDFYSLEYFEPSNTRRQRNCRYKTSMVTFTKEEIVSYVNLFNVLVLPTFTCGARM